MENGNVVKPNIGRQIKLIVRQPNGITSVYEGTLIAEDLLSYTIRTIRGERTEPKQMCAVEWITQAKPGVAGV